MYLGFPHARGGVSLSNFTSGAQVKFSPRPWGCFHFRSLHRRKRTVFPTPVGVFLPDADIVDFSGGFPHARGGVSD